MTINLPFDGLSEKLSGYKTYGALLIGLIVYFGQPYLPWLTPEFAAELTTGLFGFALLFLRAGSKTDAVKAVEEIKRVLDSSILPEAEIVTKK